jgi:nucleotide-binding universal stress UspA family protein
VTVVPATWLQTSGDGRVVVGVDGSPNSSEALRWAIAEAARRAARLVVVWTWTVPYPVAPYGLVTTPLEREEYGGRTRRRLQEMVDRAMAEARKQPPLVELLPVEGPAAITLVDVARQADLLVVGSRGRGGVRGLLLGSVSQQCVHHARCPVTVVPLPPERNARREA